MRFTFEADMEKGQCSACPFLRTQDDGCGWYLSCALNDEVTTLEVEPSECPLEEAIEIKWHPYPQERPKINPHVFYVCTLANASKKLVVPSKYTDGKFHPLAVLYDDSYVIAWAEMPEPY